MMKVVYVILYLIFATMGLTFIKLGTDGSKLAVAKGFLEMTFNWKLILGFCSYVVSFILYTVVISKYNLGYIYPIMTAVLFILVMLASAFILKESITVPQIIGAIVIIIGVFITTIKK